MSFQKTIVICLIAIGIGAAAGMLAPPPSSNPVSKNPGEAEIQEQSAAGQSAHDAELEREKAAALRELLSEREIESQ